MRIYLDDSFLALFGNECTDYGHYVMRQYD